MLELTFLTVSTEFALKCFRFFLSQSCFSAEDLVLIYNLPDNRSSGLGRSDLARLSPALVQQILSGACADVANPKTPDQLSMMERKCVF